MRAVISVAKRLVNRTPGLKQVNQWRVRRKIEKLQDMARTEIARNGLELVKSVTGALQSAEIQSCIGFGTLLGFVRESGFISHDTDIDFAFINEGSGDWDAIESQMKSLGYAKKREFGCRGRLTEQTYSTGRFTFDIFALIPSADGMCEAFLYSQIEDKTFGEVACSVRSIDLAMPRNWLMLEVQGAEVSAPSNYEEWLLALYGPNWNTPDPSYSHADYWRARPELKGFGRFF